jgi:hypothetical protein
VREYHLKSINQVLDLAILNSIQQKMYHRFI